MNMKQFTQISEIRNRAFSLGLSLKLNDAPEEQVKLAEEIHTLTATLMEEDIQACKDALSVKL